MPTEKRARKREGRAYRQEQLRRAQRRRQLQKRGIVGAVLAVVIVGTLILSSLGGGKKSSSSTSSSTTVPGATPTTTAASTPVSVPAGATLTGDTPCPKADKTSPRTTSFAKEPPMCIDVNKTYVATVTTDIGVMTFNFDAKKAPKTVNNFVVLARYSFFDGVSFHRVIPNFVDQGGDPLGTGSGGPGYKFADELPKAGEYKVGSLAMANSGPNTNGSQFFIITGAQGVSLPPSYSLFGQVGTGMDVATQINNDGTAEGTPKVLHRIITIDIKES